MQQLQRDGGHAVCSNSAAAQRKFDLCSRLPPDLDEPYSGGCKNGQAEYLGLLQQVAREIGKCVCGSSPPRETRAAVSVDGAAYHIQRRALGTVHPVAARRSSAASGRDWWAA